MIITFIIFIIIGIGLIIYAKTNDKSENFEVLLPFFSGCSMVLIGIASLIIRLILFR